ncbi:MAG: histidine phosphatase family protein [Planctomycetaceae bacterium]
MNLYLIRHGQSHVNLADLTAEHRDAPLTDVGRRQAAAVADYVAERIKPTQLYASTVARAAETAGMIADKSGLDPTFDNRLREIGTAYPDGRPVPESELEPYVPDMWGTLRPYEPVTIDGESWMQFRSRVGSFVEELVPARNRHGDPELAEKIADERVAVVCHAGVIEAVFEYVFEKGPWSVVAVQTSHTGITHLQYHPMPNFPDWWLLAHNRTEHLDEDLVT